MASQSSSSFKKQALALAGALAVIVGCAASGPTPTPATGALAPLPDGFPKDPIVMSTGAAGSSGDLLMRTLAKAAQPLSPVPLVVENLSGNFVALRSAELAMDTPGGPEGYALFNNSFSQVARSFELPPAKANWSDIGPTVFVVTDQYAVFVRTDSPWKNASDFVKYAKDNPGGALVGGGAPGGITHITAGIWSALSGFQYTYVPHENTSAAVTTLIGGGVDTVIGSIPSNVPQVKTGRIKAIGISGSARSEALPEVPTLTEQGYKVVVDQFRGVWALATVPKERVEWLQELFRRAVDTKEMKDYLAGSGEISQMNRLKEFDQDYKASIPAIENVTKALGLHYETAKKAQ
ncbi:MAG: tripartite tricarboxylate transporter substrate binding protein [Chloroflexi bacterium]|nr:tripartite tricarboxylate transporter substrate binding protein [Chloroflexota bacterium]